MLLSKYQSVSVHLVGYLTDGRQLADLNKLAHVALRLKRECCFGTTVEPVALQTTTGAFSAPPVRMVGAISFSFAATVSSLSLLPQRFPRARTESRSRCCSGCRVYKGSG